MLQELKGDATNEDVIGERLNDLLPDESFQVSGNETLKEQVRRAHALCKGIRPHQARIEYLKYLRENIKLYGSAYFAVKVRHGGEKKAQQLFVAMNSRGIHMIDWNMSGIDETISLLAIERCTHTTKKFTVWVYQKSVEFTTVQGKEMNLIYQTYLHKP